MSRPEPRLATPVTIEAITSGTISIFSRLMKSVPRKSNSLTSSKPADLRHPGPTSQPTRRARHHGDQDRGDRDRPGAGGLICCQGAP